MTAVEAVAAFAAFILAINLARLIAIRLRYRRRYAALMQQHAALMQQRQAQAQAHRDTYLASGMSDIDQMDGVDFEHCVADCLRRSGGYATVEMTSTTGDFGVDLIATNKRGRRVAIQCKRYSKPVGLAAVQQVVTGARLHGCDDAWVISNQGFTPAAIELAAAHSCSLIGRRELLASWRACEFCGYTSVDIDDINQHEAAHRRQTGEFQ